MQRRPVLRTAAAPNSGRNIRSSPVADGVDPILLGHALRRVPPNRVDVLLAASVFSDVASARLTGGHPLCQDRGFSIPREPLILRIPAAVAG